MKVFEDELSGVLGAARVAARVHLAPFTTLRIGGPADWLVTARSAKEIRDVIAVARRHDVAVTVIGGGSNVLVADAGIRGLVLRVHGGEVTALDDPFDPRRCRRHHQWPGPLDHQPRCLRARGLGRYAGNGWGCDPRECSFPGSVDRRTGLYGSL